MVDGAREIESDTGGHPGYFYVPSTNELVLAACVRKICTNYAVGLSIFSLEWLSVYSAQNSLGIDANCVRGGRCKNQSATPAVV